MSYVSWAAFYEGPSDALYFDVLLPRIIRDVILREGQWAEVPESPSVTLGMDGRSVKRLAEEACKFSEAFDVIFIHADTGGRGLEQGLANRASAYCGAMAAACNWPCDCCITLTPRHETEAWLIADGEAVMAALGYKGRPAELGLPIDPRAAERLSDPKQTLKLAIEQASGRRRSLNYTNLFPAIAQRQNLDTLRKSESFLDFESRLRRGLLTLNFMR